MPWSCPKHVSIESVPNVVVHIRRWADLHLARDCLLVVAEETCEDGVCGARAERRVSALLRSCSRAFVQRGPCQRCRRDVRLTERRWSLGARGFLLELFLLPMIAELGDCGASHGWIQQTATSLWSGVKSGCANCAVRPKTQLCVVRVRSSTFLRLPRFLLQQVSTT